jgi:septal ring-binding cell division protein DamX
VTASRQPAPNVEAGTASVVNEVAGVTEKTPQTRAQPVLQQRENSANRWSAALPALSAGVEKAPSATRTKTADREARKPPPEPEPVLARWEKAADAKTVSEQRGEEAHEPLPQPKKVVAPPTASAATVVPATPIKRRSVPAVGAVSEAGPTAIRDRRTYTVQIGAFKSDRDARAYITQHNLGDLPTLTLRRELRGPHQYVVITFGSFESASDALAAWRRSGAPRDLEIWVRPANTAPPAPPEAAPAAVAPPAS